MVSFDFVSGQVMVGRTALPLRVVEASGYLHINYPNGPILRPLSVLERWRILYYVMSQNNASLHNSKTSLAAAVLQHATVTPGAGNTTLYQAIALYMAGAAIHAPPIHQSIQLIATNMGWSPESIWSCEAALSDELAAAFQPPNASGWKQLFFTNDSQEEAAAYVDMLATRLLHRVHDESLASGDASDSAHITNSALPNDQEQSSRLNKSGMKEEKNKSHESEHGYSLNKQNDTKYLEKENAYEINYQTTNKEIFQNQSKDHAFSNSENLSIVTQNKSDLPPSSSDKHVLTPEKHTTATSASPLIIKKLRDDEAWSTATVTHDAPNPVNNEMRPPDTAPQHSEKQTGANRLETAQVNNRLPVTSRLATHHADLVNASPTAGRTPLTDVDGPFSSQNSIKHNQADRSFSAHSFVHDPVEEQTSNPSSVPHFQAHRSTVFNTQETESNERVLDFFRDSQSSIANELANLLNREADLRGI